MDVGNARSKSLTVWMLKKARMLAFSFDECRDRHNVIVTGMPKLLGGYHLWQSQDDKGELLGSKTDKRKGDLPIGKVSYTAHISNKNSSITSKSKLQGVANLPIWRQGILERPCGA